MSRLNFSVFVNDTSFGDMPDALKKTHADKSRRYSEKTGSSLQEFFTDLSGKFREIAGTTDSGLRSALASVALMTCVACSATPANAFDNKTGEALSSARIQEIMEKSSNPFEALEAITSEAVENINAQLAKDTEAVRQSVKVAEQKRSRGPRLR